MFPRSAAVPHSKLQWVHELDSCAQTPGHTVYNKGSVTLIHPFQSQGPVVSTICQSSTTRLRQDCTDRLLWQGCSDRLFWQVALTSTSYSSNKHSANFVWPTLTTYSSLYPGRLAVTNRIWDTSGLHAPTKPFSAAFVGILGPNHWPTLTTIRRDRRRATLHQVSYLPKVQRYLLLYIGELHRKSRQPPTMCSFIMLYSLRSNIRIMRPSFCSPSRRVSTRCPRSTGWEIWLDLWERPICDCFCLFD